MTTRSMPEKNITTRFYLVVDLTKVEQDETRNAIIFHTFDRLEALRYAHGESGNENEEYAVFEQVTNYPGTR